MEKYIGTKLVEAEEMTRGNYNLFRGWTIPADENPNDEGYSLKYPDGYVSWSPKEIFETAYHPAEHMTFGEAVEAMKQGARCCREGWNGKGQYIELARNIFYIGANGEIINCEHEAIGNRAIAFVGTSGVQMGWLASQADMLAEDWRVK